MLSRFLHQRPKKQSRPRGFGPLFHWLHNGRRPAGFDLTDEEVKGTTRQLVELTVQVARAMGMREGEIKNARLGVFLHDIGMAGIPDDVLFKAGPLSKRERKTVCEHPNYAHELLSSVPALAGALDIPYCHHEKWDGKGYPRGLKHDEIPLAARIFAVVDVWVALRSDRPYRPAWTEEDAHVYILQRSGRDFDPAVVEAFVALLPAPEI
jgi:HD-GYP domain-containing protein (c-di-GMP phosphodiesterase class II)